MISYMVIRITISVILLYTLLVETFTLQLGHLPLPRHPILSSFELPNSNVSIFGHCCSRRLQGVGFVQGFTYLAQAGLITCC
ncbi:hypothetical protein V1504DRAFT_463639, partial [Lipomyces starkeyi]